MNYKKIGELCHSLKKSVKPDSDTIYNVFSLPAFDDKMKPEELSGSEIKSNKFKVFENTILFNKLNVKYRRIWNIHKLTSSNNISSTEFIPLVAENGVDQDYLYHCLRSDDVTFAMHAARKGTSNSQQRIDEDILFSYEIPVPSLEEQRKIASILNSIDERIKVNEEINDNLSKQASLIFKREFLSSPVLPAGWKQGSLSDIADYLNGLAMQNHPPKENDIGLPVLKIRELRQGFCDDESDICSSCIGNEYIIHDGDVIFSWSGSLLVDFWSGGPCGLNQHLFKVTSAKFDKWFYYSWTKHYQDYFAAIAAGRATTMGHIKRGELTRAKVSIPSETDYQRIGAILDPIYRQIVANRIQNNRLASLRDSLLPRLLNGYLEL